jgi:SAM-dependent methyltransferase
MTAPSPRARQIFLELYEGLPRQGPGDLASARRALALCRDAPPAPAIADLGCGVGAQTFHLAALTGGSIVAVDRHAPAVARLEATAAALGLAHRIRTVVGDLADPGLLPASFDLVWSEGALYAAGLARALATCRTLLRPGGHLAFTDAVWRVDDPPPEAKASFDFDYPAMGRVPDVLAHLARAGFSVLGHFPLPEEAWWEEFYGPMERRIEALRHAHAGDREALDALDALAREPELHRRLGWSYAYEFFVARAPPLP